MEYADVFRMISKAEEFLSREDEWDALTKPQQAILASKTERLNRVALHRIVNGHSGFQLMKMNKESK